LAFKLPISLLPDLKGLTKRYKRDHTNWSIIAAAATNECSAMIWNISTMAGANLARDVDVSATVRQEASPP